MQQWEYHHEPASPTITRLNELGCDGWEYAGLLELTDEAATTFQDVDYRTTRLGLLFKRPALTVESMLESATAAQAPGVSVDPALQ